MPFHTLRNLRRGPATIIQYKLADALSFLVLQIKEADLCTQVPRHVSAMGIGEKKIDGKLEQG